MTDVEQNGDSVEVYVDRNGETASVTAAFVAGCDGAHSQVRTVVVSSFSGRTYQAQAALADVTFDQKQDVRFPRLTHRQGATTAIRIDDRIWRLIMPRSLEEGVSLETRIERAVHNLFPTSGYETVWKSEFNLHRRVSSSFTKGRIVLAGDGAHLTSPVGGQGMNLGLQDAAALTEALNRALNRDTLKPLVGYTSERRDAVEAGAVWGTDQLTQVLLARRGTTLVPFLHLFRATAQLRERAVYGP